MRNNVSKKTASTPRNTKKNTADLAMFKSNEASYMFSYSGGGQAYLISAYRFVPDSPQSRKQLSEAQIEQLINSNTKDWYAGELDQLKMQCENSYDGSWEYNAKDDSISNFYSCRQGHYIYLYLMGYYRNVGNTLVRVDAVWKGYDVDKKFKISNPKTWPVSKEEVEETKQRFKTISMNCPD